MRQIFARPLIAIFAGAVILTVAGCSSFSSKEEDAEYVDRPVEDLYNTAVNSAASGNFRAAAPLFDEVERQHPYSVWATQAQLMAAYSLYQSNQYDDAVNALDRFIQLNPSHSNVDYAYYLKGLSFYERIVDVGRDQKLTRDALDTFDEVIKRFPRSKYARDARLKVDLARNHLAGKEMEIGRFYLTRDQYLAAINRFRRVVRNYDTTDQVPEALHRLTEAYLALGLTEEAEKTAAVLGHNYPGNNWYQDSYALVKTGRPYSAEGDGEGLLGLGLWIF
jgi:outer membrane protein assembly factor BamD